MSVPQPDPNADGHEQARRAFILDLGRPCVLTVGRSQFLRDLRTIFEPERDLDWYDHLDLPGPVPRRFDVALIDLLDDVGGRGTTTASVRGGFEQSVGARINEKVFVIHRRDAAALLREKQMDRVDFLLHPFQHDELLFRMRAALARSLEREWLLHLEGREVSMKLDPDAGHVVAESNIARLSYEAAMRVCHTRAARYYLALILSESHGNVARAAREAGLERESLHRLLRRHDVAPGEFRRGRRS